jgi:D-amino-acid dehydrogenase
MKVTVIERQGARRNGCSFGNAGMVVPSHFVPLAAPGMVGLGLRWMWNPESPFSIRPRLDFDWIAWGLRFWRSATAEHVHRSAPALRDLSFLSRRCYEELADDGLDFGLVRHGLLMLCKTQRTLDEEAHVAQMARSLGLTAEVLDARGTAALDPAITMDVRGSVYFAQDCHLSPERFLDAVERESTRLGVEFLWGATVAGFAQASDRIRAAQTSQGDVTGDEFVICGGVWSARLAKALRLRLPMQTGKGYSLTLPAPRQLPRLCSICTEARVAVTPMGESLRFAGTMELGAPEASVNQRRIRGIIRAATEYFPAFQESDFEGLQPWSGLRPVSPDGLPYIGRSPRWKNLSIAAGHAMLGLSLAPATGKIIADLLAGHPSPVPTASFAPDRFE